MMPKSRLTCPQTPPPTEKHRLTPCYYALSGNKTTSRWITQCRVVSCTSSPSHAPSPTARAHVVLPQERGLRPEGHAEDTAEDGRHPGHLPRHKLCGAAHTGRRSAVSAARRPHTHRARVRSRSLSRTALPAQCVVLTCKLCARQRARGLKSAHARRAPAAHRLVEAGRLETR